MCTGVLHACVPGTSVGFPGTTVTGSREPSSGCWALNPDPLQEQQVPLTMEPSLEPPRLVLEDPTSYLRSKLSLPVKNYLN